MADVLQTRARMDRDESSRRIEAPFLDATGAPEGLARRPYRVAGREERERDAAWRRGEDRASEGGRQAREPYRGKGMHSSITAAEQISLVTYRESAQCGIRVEVAAHLSDAVLAPFPVRQ
jgi:hypothetical protein